jgi:hypothetical protein
MLDSGRARPLSIATADFDGDGMVDTVCGYGDGNGDGLGELRRGNPDSLFPNSPGALARKAENRFSDAPFERESTLVSLPTEPDFLMAGDFDGDGLQDLACASSGKSAFFVLLGNGKGGFGEPLRISLSAPLTFLAVGEVNRRDGLPELVAGVSGTEGARLVVFEGTAGAVSGTPEEIELPAEPVEVVFGRFGEDYPRDMAVLLASGEVVMVQGRDRELSFDTERRAAVPGPSLVSVSLPGSAALAAGDFLGSGRDVLASLSSDGSLFFIDPRRPSELLMIGQAIEMASRADAEPLRARLVAIPAGGADRLVVLEGGQALLSPAVDTIRAGATASAVSLVGSTVAILPMRLNVDAFTDLLVLGDDPNDPLRVVPAAASEKVFVVNTDAYGEDAGFYADERTWDGICATEEGACTLNAAIWECAGPAGNGTCTIRFNVSASGVPAVGFRDGAADSGLCPTAVYDGTTQPGGFVRISSNTNTIRFKANSVLRGIITQYAEVGDHSTVEGCRFGTNDDGSSFDGWGGALAVASDCTVGGTTSAARNLFSCNPLGTVDSLVIKGDGNTVRGNWFGINAAGTELIPVGTAIRIVTADGETSGAADNTIGGTSAAARNVLWGRGAIQSAVVQIDAGTSGNLFQGNYLGTDPSGTVAIGMGNALTGIHLGGLGNTVGGSAATARNIIVGPNEVNVGAGIEVFGSPSETGGLVIQGNYIGLDNTGAARLGTWTHGVVVSPESEAVTIGGAASGAGNVIAGNRYYGVYIEGKDDQTGVQGTNRANVIQGNYLGTDKTGTIAIPNMYGVIIVYSPDNLVGGTESGARNIISGNSMDGIHIAGDTAVRNIIRGNYIGVDATGMKKLSQPWYGVFIESPENTIGGLTRVARNVISCNGMGNVRLHGSAARRNKIQGNYLGPGADGVTDPGGGWWGVQVIEGASDNVIGGKQKGAANIIAFNTYQGVPVISNGEPHSVGNAILGNSIHSTVKMGIDLGCDDATANDYQDSDVGPNKLQNAPELTSIETVSGYNINGKLHSSPNTKFRLEFFANCSLNDNNLAGGETFIGARNVTTGSLGDAVFAYTFPAPKCPMITATATDPEGNTSEFSLWVAPVAPVFKDNFSKGTSRWKVMRGGWSVDSKQYVSDSNKRNLAIVKKFDPTTAPIGAGRIQSTVTLTDTGKGGPNGALIFGYADNGNYRWVRLKPGKVLLGQTGTLNGDPPGTLASAAAPVKIGKSCTVRLDVYPDGLVEVFINNEKVLSGTFPNGVAPGGVGLSADKTSSVFDDFTVWDESVLPES